MDCKLGRVDSESGKYSCSPSLLLVISPLISLMVDQVLSLRQRGVNAAVISYGSGVKKELLVTEMIWANTVCCIAHLTHLYDPGGEQPPRIPSFLVEL